MFNNDPLVRRMFACCSLVAGVIIVGTVGYILLEGWDPQDSFYMTVITLSTVGFGETQQLTPVGRIFTTGLIFLSVVCISIWTASLTSLMVEGDLTGSFRRKRVIKMLSSINGHTIVCGSGPMAAAVLERLSRKRLPVVLIDGDKSRIEILRRRYPKLPIVEAEGVDELALANAQLLSAKSVVAVLESDFDNLLVAMTCKDTGANVRVVARSDDPKIASRMLRIGVEEVICPLQLSGDHIANLLTA